MAALKLVCALVACMLVVAPMAQAAVTCGTVTSSVAPCIGYLRGGGALPPACCSGVKSLNNAAVTTADRQTACRCLQNAAKQISGINLNLAAALPGKCGVNGPVRCFNINGVSGPENMGLELFKEMLKNGIEISQSIYARVFRSCAGLSAFRLGTQLHAHDLKTGFESDIIVGMPL
ncbi:hypothetical protein EZV62_016793 [Acer yangbiense]|uniref:Non-specific lipid-transfer protein n=1 Tax=Acer yangbiense TaxID=1000413 RepID=A0A5C7HQ46_9ROSI|nr:hypothetical protein EZV62_016793 [Acer yangbiense]